MRHSLEIEVVPRKKWSYIGNVYRGSSKKKVAVIYASSEVGLYLRVLCWRCRTLAGISRD